MTQMTALLVYSKKGVITVTAVTEKKAVTGQRKLSCTVM